MGSRLMPFAAAVAVMTYVCRPLLSGRLLGDIGDALRRRHFANHCYAAVGMIAPGDISKISLSHAEPEPPR